MVLEVEWSPAAGRDVEAIKDYIRRDSELYARIVTEKLIEVGRKIERFPQAGRIVPELQNEKFRERSVYSYRVIYRIQEDRITVVAVVHGKRLLRSLGDRFEP